MAREEFLKLYANLPVKLREEVILVLDKKDQLLGIQHILK